MKKLTSQVKKAREVVKVADKLLAENKRGKKEKIFKQEIQNELCMLKGCFFDSKEIIKIINEKFKTKFLVKQVDNFFSRLKHREQMLECRQNYLAEISEVPITHKRIRLERLEKQWQKTKDEFLKIKVSQEARKEVEGELTNLTLNVFKKYEGLTDDELETRKIELFKRIGEYSGRIREAETIEPV